MGLRDRIKGRIKKVIGRQEPEQAPAAPPPSRPAVAKPTPAPQPVAAPAPPPPAALSPEEQEMQEKAAKHLIRTRKGVLKFMVKKGGTASLADMHQHSEMRFFVGHKKFSNMMEALIAEGLLEYNHAEGTGAITPAGEEYIAS